MGFRARYALGVLRDSSNWKSLNFCEALRTSCQHRMCAATASHRSLASPRPVRSPSCLADHPAARTSHGYLASPRPVPSPSCPAGYPAAGTSHRSPASPQPVPRRCPLPFRAPTLASAQQAIVRCASSPYAVAETSQLRTRAGTPLPACAGAPSDAAVTLQTMQKLAAPAAGGGARRLPGTVVIVISEDIAAWSSGSDDDDEMMS